MADNDTIAQPQAPIIAKAGKVERIPITFPQDNSTNENPENNGINSTEENVTEGANATTANEGGAGDDKNKPTPPAPTLTDEQLTAYFKAQGIEYTGLEDLKAKINATPSTEQTPEQKEAIAKAKETRALNKFIEGGGTGDQFYAIKQVAEADVSELSKNTLKKELKDAGFNEEEVDTIIKERYYQIQIEELEQNDDEDDEAFENRKNAIKRKKEYGDKLLSNRSLPIKTQAAGILADLNKTIESEDLQVQNELTISANIDEQFKTLQRKDTYEIGEINGKPIPPIESEVPEKELAQVREMLKDPAQRNNFLLHKDGGFNYTNILNLFVENVKLKAAVKVSYHTGTTRNNEHWQSTFGASSPQELGVGGSQSKPNGQTTGKPVSYGKPQRIQPQRQ